MSSALTELAELIAVNVERAPGQTEKRLVLLRGVVEAHRLNDADLA